MSEGKREPKWDEVDATRRNAPPAPPTTFRRLCRIFFRLMIFCLVVFIVVAIGLGVWASRYLAPIKLDKADPDRLAGWLVFRDLDEETAETQFELLKRYVATFGPGTVSAESAPPSSQGFVQSLSRRYSVERGERVALWLDSLGPTDPWRCEYRVLPVPRARGEFPLSWEVVATDRLALSKHAPLWPPVPAAFTKTEQNLRLLTRRWFQLKMQEFDHTQPTAKERFLAQTADEMLWWQDYYNDFREGLGLDRLGQIELLGELLVMTASWYEVYPEDELARLLWFRDLLLVTATGNQAGLGKKISNKISSLPTALAGLDTMCRQLGVTPPAVKSPFVKWLQEQGHKSEVKISPMKRFHNRKRSDLVPALSERQVAPATPDTNKTQLEITPEPLP
ncbi:MAG: hypothetical protein Q4G68_08425 [Planctomycetia bacterium]|nr:hypothetical protein [Planctomycetia bacterium]